MFPPLIITCFCFNWFAPLQIELPLAFIFVVSALKISMAVGGVITLDGLISSARVSVHTAMFFFAATALTFAFTIAD